MVSLKSTTPDSAPRSNRALFFSFVIIAIASLIIASILTGNHLLYRSKITDKTRANLQSITAEAAKDIGKTITETMQAADAIADDLTKSRFTKEQIKMRLRQTLEQQPYLYGGGIAFEPHGFDPDRRLYAPYYKKSSENGNLELVMIDESYDYTEPQHEWYSTAIAKNKPWWVESFWGEASQRFLTSYSAVFFKNDPIDGTKTPAGVVIFTISMDKIKKLINSLELGPSGFGALVSQKGIYLYHPNNDYVISRKNILDVAKEKKDKDRLLLAEKAARGESGIMNHVSTTTGRVSWLTYAPIPRVGWSLHNTFLKDDIPINVDTLRHQLFQMIVAWLVFLAASGALVSRIHQGNIRGIWGLSLTGTLFIILGVGLLWTIALIYNPIKRNDGIKIFDATVLQKIMNEDTNRSKEKHLPAPVYVPTGVFIESMRFSGPDDIFMSGYIWQKYDASFPQDVKKKITIAKATNVFIREAHRESSHDYEIIKYYFEAEIQQNFNHKKYPLEQELITICIFQEELNHNIVLVPDIDSYEIRGSSNLPGIDNDAFLAGWKLTNSFYELQQRDMNTNFGLYHNAAGENHPTLHYNIRIQRNFIDAFISNLTPIIIVAIMLFFLLMLSNRLDAAQVFSICVAMFFVIVFSHIDIRRKISVGEIFYLEYFYFLTYGAILYASLNAVGIMLESKWRLFRAGNDLIPRALFWPTLYSLIFIVTFFMFY